MPRVVGTICYATEQGLGHLAKSFYEAGVIQSVLVFKHPQGRLSQMHWYPGAQEIVRPFAGQKVVQDFISSIDTLLCFETPFDWEVIGLCRTKGVKTVLVTMYEWSLLKPPYKFDEYICPSKLDLQYFPTGRFIPIPAPQGTWRKREKALTLLHNAGNIGSQMHKGTVEVLTALRHVKSPISLTVRCQNAGGLKSIVDSIPGVCRDKRLKIHYGPVPYESLFSEHDVYLAPEKYNGLSLPLQEAYAAGMLVMTSDRFPNNDWLPREPLIPTSGEIQTQVAKGHNLILKSIVRPESVAEAVDAWYGADISHYSEKGREWALANSWDVLKPKYLEVLL